MAQSSEYILDTCSYLRISKDLAPCLGAELGQPPIKLRLIPGFSDEFDKSSRLNTTFFWANMSPHPNDRKAGTLKVKKGRESTIRNTYDFMLKTAQRMKVKTSYVDLMSAATSYEYNLPFVTDDQGLRKVVDEYCEEKFKWVSSMFVLKELKENGYIDLKKINDIVSFWIMNNDEPYKNWEVEFQNLFGVSVPNVN